MKSNCNTSDSSSNSICSQEILESVSQQRLRELDKALPFVNNKVSMDLDIKLGWKPKNNVVYVAPIPLYYDFGEP